MFTLRPDQIDDLAWHITNARGILRHDPGVGKTPIACLLAWHHWSASQSKTVWIQPKSLLRKNRDEMLRFSEFAPEDVEILTVDRLKASPSEQKGLAKGRRYKRLADFPHLWNRLATGEEIDLIAESKAKVLLVGFRFFTRFWDRLLEAHPDIDLCLIDEAHKAYGSASSQTSNALFSAMRHIRYFAAMTATLVNGRLDTVFPVLHIIEPRYYGSHAGFIAQHAGFIDDYGKVLTWTNTQKITQLLERHSTFRSFSDTYGPEAVVFFTEKIEVTPAVREKYDEFHMLAMLELEEMLLDGSQPGVAAVRARQILAHPETFGIAPGEITGKDERLEIHASEPGNLAIFSALIPEQERIAKQMRALGRKVGVINGSVSGEERGRIDADFRAGRLDTIVGTPGCMDVGFNWPSLDHVIFVTMDFLDTSFVQAYYRGLRGQRTKPLRVTTMIYEDTIDERTADIVSAKSRQANEVDTNRRVLKFDC